MMMNTARKQERIEFRTTENSKQKLEEAALVSGCSVSTFVCEAALQKAENVIEQHKRSQISSEQWESVMDALCNPPEPTALMREIIEMSVEDSWQVTIKK